MATTHGGMMDDVYRTQRHFYDLTRKYYLLGRDKLIAELGPPPGGSVLEIGCGTGRNLVAVGRRYPGLHLYGVDISSEMLVSARKSIARAAMGERAVLAEGDAADFDAIALFGQAQFDRVFISYALSMIPDWQGALEQAARCVAPGGRLDIVDFGQQEALPKLWRRGLFAWLAKFHVAPRADLGCALARLADAMGSTGHCRSLYRGYAIMGGIVRG